MQRILSLLATLTIALAPAAVAGAFAVAPATSNTTATTSDAKPVAKTTTSTTAATTSLVSAVATTGNGAPSGAHYNLNIIGVPKQKTADLTGSNGHVIFVNLVGNTKINLSPGDFQVLDANGTDGVAAFQLPNPDPNGTGVTAYSVYARALGTPKGSAVATSCTTDVLGVTYCSTENVVLVRSSGRQTFDNVSKQLLTVCLDTNGDGVCDVRQSLFADSTSTYLWSYDNNGLKLAQLRFYQLPTTVGTTP